MLGLLNQFSFTFLSLNDVDFYIATILIILLANWQLLTWRHFNLLIYLGFKVAELVKAEMRSKCRAANCLRGKADLFLRISKKSCAVA